MYQCGGRFKNLWGPALKDLDRLEGLVNPTISNPGKSRGHEPFEPPFPPAKHVKHWRYSAVVRTGATGAKAPVHFEKELQMATMDLGMYYILAPVD